MAKTGSKDAAVKEPLEQLDLCDVPGVMPPRVDNPLVNEDGTPFVNSGKIEALPEPTDYVVGVDPASDTSAVEGSEPASDAGDEQPQRDILEVDPTEFTFDELKGFTMALRDHLIRTRNVADRLDVKLLEHRTLMAAMLDAAGGRIKVNATHMRRADPRRVLVETGLEGGEVSMRLRPKSDLWVPGQ